MAPQISSKNFGRSGKQAVGSECDCTFHSLKVAEELCLKPIDEYTWQMEEGKSKILRTKPYAF